MLNDIKVGLLEAVSSIKRGNKKTLAFVIFVLALIFVNLVFLPSMIGGLSGTMTGLMQDYKYGDIVIEPSENNPYINNADSVVQKVRSISGVRSATKRLDTAASIQYKEKNVGVTLTGIIPNEELEISKYPYIISEGDFLGELSKNEIILGAMIAGTGFGSEIYDNLGEVHPGVLVNVTYNNGVKKTYKVKGIMEGTFELVDLNALTNYKEIESVYGLNKSQQATSIVIRVNNPEEKNEIKNEIIDLGIKEKVFTWEEKADVLIRQAMESINTIDIISKYISLIVGAALIFIIVYINVLNRKKEIGILKAVGISKMSIVISYAFISMFYVSMGIIFGLILYFLLIIYFTFNPVSFYQNLSIIPEIQMSLILKSVMNMMIMSIIAGILPAWIISKESILEAIWGR
ncbi:MAG: ABC transporter permease [Candidatus Nanoarchaeia archaeon]|nr:ABC transporter permease [Candidatus Nanoarchaeia archaeon]